MGVAGATYVMCSMASTSKQYACSTRPEQPDHAIVAASLVMQSSTYRRIGAARSPIYMAGLPVQPDVQVQLRRRTS
jgi:hypothetical protein